MRVPPITIFAVASGLVIPSWGQNPQVNLGPPRGFAVDQPTVSFSVFDGDTLLGPSPGRQTFLLDTGATSLIAFGAAASDLHRSSGDFDTGRYRELGISGFADYFVSEPLTVRVGGVTANGISSPVTLPETRVLSNPFEGLVGAASEFNGIVGMPAMNHRVTSLGFTSEGDGLVDWSDPNSIRAFINSGAGSAISVQFRDGVPRTRGHRYRIPARALHFATEGDTIPSVAPLPLIEVSHRIGCEMSTGSYVFDTGAQISIMSLSKLAELGLNADDAHTHYNIQGIGGGRRVPAFLIDEYRISSAEGVDLVWRNDDTSVDRADRGVEVLGLDLHASLDGVIGSDLLTSGLPRINSLEPHNILGLINAADPAIESLHMDFRHLAAVDHARLGTLHFDIVPQRNSPTDQGIVREADGNADGVVDRRDYAIWLAHNGQSGTRCSSGDFNRDGQTNAADLALWTEQSGIGTPPNATTCDLNDDLICDVTDIDLLLTAGGTEDDRFDLDLSGGPVDLADRDAWLTAAGIQNIGAPYLAGDLNFDGAVNAQDLNELAIHWTQSSGLSYADGDLDGDQYVGASDLNTLGRNWRRIATPAAVTPVAEPASTAITTVLGCLLLLTRRRNRPERRDRFVSGTE